MSRKLEISVETEYRDFCLLSSGQVRTENGSLQIFEPSYEYLYCCPPPLSFPERRKRKSAGLIFRRFQCIQFRTLSYQLSMRLDNQPLFAKEARGSPLSSWEKTVLEREAEMELNCAFFCLVPCDKQSSTARRSMFFCFYYPWQRYVHF